MRAMGVPAVLAACLMAAALPGWAAGTAASPTSFDEVMKDPNRTIGFVPKALKTGARAGPKYQVWVPLEYRGIRKWPVILYLHGPQGCGTDGEKMLAQGLPHQIAERQGRFEFIVVIPQCPSAKRGWIGSGEKVALRALAATFEQYRCDRERLYLTGVATGGTETYALAAKHPMGFAAIAPVGGVGNTRSAKRLARLPAWIWHGQADKDVPVWKAREMAKALKTTSATVVKYTEVPGAASNAWRQAYAGDDLWNWFLTYTCPVPKVATGPVDDRAPGGLRKIDGKFETGKFEKMSGKMEKMPPMKIKQ